MSDLGFFGNGILWTGRIVPWNSQKEQVSGNGWGWRYKVRIMGYYPNSNEIGDGDVVYATVGLSATDGTGGGGRYRSVRYAQGDQVYGFWAGPDNQVPVIMGAFPRTSGIEHGGSGPFDPIPGFTKDLGPGLLKNQEANENDGPKTPQLEQQQKENNGTNQPRETPKDKLQQQMGIDPEGENEVGAIEKPPERNSDLTAADKVGPNSDALYIQKNGKTRYQEGLERLGASPEEAAREAAELRASLLSESIARDYSPQEKAEDKMLLRSIQKGELGPVPQEQIDQIINRINGVGVRQA